MLALHILPSLFFLAFFGGATGGGGATAPTAAPWLRAWGKYGIYGMNEKQFMALLFAPWKPNYPEFARTI